MSLLHTLSVKATVCLLALAGASFLSTPASAIQLYAQPSNYPYSNSASQYDPTAPNPHIATSYDNFALSANAVVNEVHWDGEFVPDTTSNPITGFTITFYTDNAGQPGTALVTESIAGNAHQTLYRTFGNASAEYSYSTALPMAFSVVAGRTYWISIVATAPQNPQWFWSSSLSGDGSSYTDLPSVRLHNAWDSAFALLGTVRR